jgi:hypothetical protein
MPALVMLVLMLLRLVLFSIRFIILFYSKQFSDALSYRKGMLASAETIEVVAKALQEHHVTTTVIDPV